MLIAAGSLTGAVGTGPTVVLGFLWAGAALLIAVGWRKTGRALALSMGMFVVWAATTLIGR